MHKLIKAYNTYFKKRNNKNKKVKNDKESNKANKNNNTNNKLQESKKLAEKLGVKHIGVILDGNRRWARARGKKPWQGHKAGAKKLEQFLKWCDDLGVKELTLYVLSAQNMNRTAKEKEFLFKIFKEYFTKYKDDEHIKKEQVKINFIGMVEKLPRDLKTIIKQVKDKTRNYSRKVLNFCMVYGGREEITNAVKKIALKVKKGIIDPAAITMETVQKHLWLQSEPDLIIRTGNVVRTSNFLPWQFWYSEWFFLKKMWPDITKKDLENVLKQFAKRERRFGR